MIKVTESKAKTTAAKKNITVSGVSIKNGRLADEEGLIGEKLFNELPDWLDTFNIKISFELPDEE